MVNPVGRPSSYRKEMPKQVLYYIENFSEYGDVIPSVVGLAAVIDVTSKTIQRWVSEGKHTEFCRTLEKLEDKQHQTLVNGGLSSSFNSTITKLALHNHGYSEKTETNINVGELPSIDDYYND